MKSLSRVISFKETFKFQKNIQNNDFFKAICQLKDELNFSLDCIKQGNSKPSSYQAPILETLLEKVSDILYENENVNGNGNDDIFQNAI